MCKDFILVWIINDLDVVSLCPKISQCTVNKAFDVSSNPPIQGAGNKVKAR